MTEEKLLLTPGEAARALGVCKKTLSRMAAKRQGPATIFVRSARRYPADELKRWLKQQIEQPPTQIRNVRKAT